jgi:hypothetical protein
MNGATLRFSLKSIGWAALLVLLAGPWHVALAAQCPKLLMFDGFDIRTQDNAQQAAYWGRTVGVQGFFLNSVMPHWQKDVGAGPNSEIWQDVAKFQSLYSKEGVTDNFIKVASYKAHDWKNAKANDAAVARFRHAAMLAKYAKLKGVALDLEPYVPIWGGPAAGPGLETTIEQEGRAIGEAMHQAYPDMTLFVLPDVLDQTQRYATLLQRFKSGVHAMKAAKKMPKYNRYEMAVPFMRGLLSVPWSHVVIGMEQTYSRNADGMGPSVQRTEADFARLMGKSAASMHLSGAPGLWPLGPTRTNKAARESPGRFADRLRAAYAAANQYVWIYGHGSAWQTDGPYAPGPVTPEFNQFTDAIHRVETRCQASR